MIAKKSYNENDKGDLITVCECKKGEKGGDVMVGSTACILCIGNYGYSKKEKWVFCDGI